MVNHKRLRFCFIFDEPIVSDLDFSTPYSGTKDCLPSESLIQGSLPPRSRRIAPDIKGNVSFRTQARRIRDQWHDGS